MSSGSSIAGEPPVVAAPPPPEGEPARGASTRWRPASSRPPPSLLLVWVVYPAGSTIYRSFFSRSGDEFVGFENYQEIFHERPDAHRDQEQLPLAPDRPRVRDGGRPDLRRAHRAGALVGRVQDRRLHADGDLGLRRGRHLARDGPEGPRHRRHERGDPGGQGLRHPAGSAFLGEARDGRCRAPERRPDAEDAALSGEHGPHRA